MTPLTAFRQRRLLEQQLFTKQAVALDTIGHAVQDLVLLGAAECARRDLLPDLDGLTPVTKATGVNPVIRSNANDSACIGTDYCQIITGHPCAPDLDAGPRPPVVDAAACQPPSCRNY